MTEQQGGTVRLSTTQRWALGLVASAMLGTVGIFYNAYRDQQEITSGLTTQVAVMNASIASLTAQLADVPEIRRNMAKLQEHQQDLDRRVTTLENKIQ